VVPEFALKRGGILLAWISAGWLLHNALLWALGLLDQASLLSASYLFNGFLGALLLITLLTLAAKNKSNLGFFYMGGSLLKFAGFFVWFYPHFKADGQMDGLEGTTFFAPYFIVLIYNTITLLKLLNSEDSGA
jgi:hypothetical protein